MSTQDKAAQRPGATRQTRTRRNVSAIVNIFDQAAPAQSDKKEKRKKIVLNERDYPGISVAISNVNKLRSQKKVIESRLKQNETAVLGAAKKEFLGAYMADQKNPGTFVATGSRGIAEILVVPCDSYKGIDADKALELTNEFGPEIVKETEMFGVDIAMIMLYKKQISEAIMASTSIPDEDKVKIFTKTTSYQIAPGTIDDLVSFGDDMQDVFYEIQSQFQLRTA